jgi:hypothetical protein
VTPPEEPPRFPPQRSNAEACTVRLELMTAVFPGISIAVPAALVYRRAEPYAVYLHTDIDTDETVTWVFARDLLATGLHTWAGMGDVSVYPGPGDARIVYISLACGDETAVLRARSGPVRAFLQQTQCLVPLGLEHEHIDLDTAARRLLDPPPPRP